MTNNIIICKNDDEYNEDVAKKKNENKNYTDNLKLLLILTSSNK